MKNVFFLIGLCLLCTVVEAEDNTPTDSVPAAESTIATPYIEYEYDASGNRKGRVYHGVVYMPTSKSAKLISDEEDGYDEVFEKVLREGFSVRLFPNPTKGVLNLECFGNADCLQRVFILSDLNGRVLQKETMHSPVHQLEMHHLPEGAYVLTLKQGDDIFRFKIIKQ